MYEFNLQELGRKQEGFIEIAMVGLYSSFEESMWNEDDDEAKKGETKPEECKIS